MKKGSKEEPEEPGSDGKLKTSLFGGGGDEEEGEKQDTGRFYLEMFKTILLVVIAGMGAFAFIRAAYSADRNILPDFLVYFFYPFQFTQIYLTYFISKVLGWGPALDIDKLIISYPSLGSGARFEIVTACTAVCEMGLITAVILAFRGPKLRKRLIWAGVFSGIVYLENVLRLVMNYPLYKYLGDEGWNFYHYKWMQYGQLVVVILLRLIYVLAIANKEITAVYRGRTTEDKEKDEDDLSKDKPDRKKNKGRKAKGPKKISKGGKKE